MRRWLRSDAHRWLSAVLMVFLGLGTILCLSSNSDAAFVTDITDSFDFKNKRPFGFRLLVSYDLQVSSATIAREYCRVSSDPAYARSCRTPPRSVRTPYDDRFFSNAPEFDLARVRHAMNIQAFIGLYKDLDIFVRIPIVFSDNTTIRNSSDPRFGNATLVKEGIVPSRILSGGEATARHTLGLGDLSLGIRWAAFNNARDRSKATWVLGFDWTIPTGEVWTPGDPRIFSNDGPGGGVGRGTHVLHFYTTLSKRLGPFDPYVQ
ncbi:MAG: hypothetical protein AAGJ35_14615, partial [Myxococcota bacterium]